MFYIRIAEDITSVSCIIYLVDVNAIVNNNTKANYNWEDFYLLFINGAVDAC